MLLFCFNLSFAETSRVQVCRILLITDSEYAYTCNSHQHRLAIYVDDRIWTWNVLISDSTNCWIFRPDKPSNGAWNIDFRKMIHLLNINSWISFLFCSLHLTMQNRSKILRLPVDNLKNEYLQVLNFIVCYLASFLSFTFFFANTMLLATLGLRLQKHLYW